MNIHISVIIPFYNSTNTIIECINSVISQTIKPFEIILINDGSTDDSLFKINKTFSSEISNEYIKIFTRQNQGVSSARNLGILKSYGNWIAFLDSDDLWVDNKLEDQIEALDKYPECKIFSTASNILFFKKNDTPFYIVDYKKILFKNYFSTSSVLIEKNALLQSSCFNISKKYSEDYELWLSILYKFKFGVIINKKLLIYTIHNNNKLSNNYLEMYIGELDNYKCQYIYKRINLLLFTIVIFVSTIKFILRLLKSF